MKERKISTYLMLLFVVLLGTLGVLYHYDFAVARYIRKAVGALVKLIIG